MPLPHNVGRSRVQLGEARSFSELPWEHGEEELKFHAQNDKTKVYHLVVEFHQDTGWFVLYTEWRYAEGYGGDVLQERNIGDVIRQANTRKKQVEEQDIIDARNEADAIGG